MRTGKDGFTLLELIIVMIVLSIVVSIALPQYTQFVVKTEMAAEARMGLNMLRKSEAAYFIMHNGVYLGFQTMDDAIAQDLGVKLSDFDGKYLDHTNYYVASDGTVFCTKSNPIPGVGHYIVSITPSGIFQEEFGTLGQLGG